MPRASIPITNFSGGERGSLSVGRIDVSNYNNGCQLLENFIPIIEGPLVKRPGSRHVGLALEIGTQQVLLVPYQDSTGANFILEMGELNIRVWDATGAIVDSLAEGYSEDRLPFLQWAQNGDLLVFVDGKEEPKVFSLDNGTIVFGDLNADCGPLNSENVDVDTTIVCSGVSGSITAVLHVDGGAAEDLFGNSGIFGFRTIPQALYDQWQTDTTYIIGDYVWSQSYESSRANVYKALTAGTSGTRTPGHDLGTETDGVVQWQMVHSEFGFARVVTPPDGQGAPVELEVVCFPEIPADFTIAGSVGGLGSFRFSFGAWHNDSGPAAVCFHESRLVFGGGPTTIIPTSATPSIQVTEATFRITNGPRLWGSKIDRFGDFYPGIDDNDGYNFQVNAELVTNIIQLYSGKELFINTTSGFFAANGGLSAITPTNINVRRHNAIKCKQSVGVSVQNGIIFTQVGGKTVRETLFEERNEQYISRDISILSNDIEALGLNSWTLMQSPTPIVWTWTDTGDLIGISYEREYEVIAFHRHSLTDTDGGIAKVISVQVIPDPNKVNDRLWLAVERTIDSVTKTHLEYIDITDQAWSDNYLEYSGVPTDVITGLEYLEGELVAVMGDDAVLASETVVGGQITIDREVSEAIVGLPYAGQFDTQKLEGGSELGNSQGKLKRIHSVIMRLDKTGPGLLVGTNEDNMVLVVMRDNTDLMDNPVPPFTGDRFTAINGSNDQSGVLHVEHQLPQPCTIIAMWPQIEVSDRT